MDHRPDDADIPLGVPLFEVLEELLDKALLSVLHVRIVLGVALTGTLINRRSVSISNPFEIQLANILKLGFVAHLWCLRTNNMALGTWGANQSERPRSRRRRLDV